MNLLGIRVATFRDTIASISDAVAYRGKKIVINIAYGHAMSAAIIQGMKWAPKIREYFFPTPQKFHDPEGEALYNMCYLPNATVCCIREDLKRALDYLDASYKAKSELDSLMLINSTAKALGILLPVLITHLVFQRIAPN